ncbi:hypothetical protein NADFUDRAFT_81926 [Nadsonia fulvescens var. elongata DSM 6958]|uniref:Uncharacterized protein n=1 Tax=Nadsonia fulvescens var. elongata DSM 6958 TaxID=857566 RepID=A0A1E3PPU4_9ASCO|nr:hypothetical protein NADFUDRAFT_81926 [Nadsonia fulvescens var. elongata DSM 6958]
MLLGFNRWASSVKPYIPFQISRWLFAGCIILSILLLLYEVGVAWNLKKVNNISLTYTNPILRNYYSVRGYDYFCLFAKLTSSRKFTEYVVLFVYFTFKNWIKLVFTESPRQVLNAMSLYSVLKIEAGFVETIKDIATNSKSEAIVIIAMSISLGIWAISVIQFVIALICAIPIYSFIEGQNYHGLEEFCCSKINERIAKLVEKYHNKSLRELKISNRRLSKRPTLPTFDFGLLDGKSRNSQFLKGQALSSTMNLMSYDYSSDNQNDYNLSYPAPKSYKPIKLQSYSCDHQDSRNNGSVYQPQPTELLHFRKSSISGRNGAIKEIKKAVPLSISINLDADFSELTRMNTNVSNSSSILVQTGNEDINQLSDFAVIPSTHHFDAETLIFKPEANTDSFKVPFNDSGYNRFSN